jgi:hypothetical protein
MSGGQQHIGVHVGIGHPTFRNGKFKGADIYWVLIKNKLQVRFIENDNPNHRVLLEAGDYNKDNPTSVVFDPIFASLSRGARINRAIRYISVANIPQGWVKHWLDSWQLE